MSALHELQLFRHKVLIADSVQKLPTLFLCITCCRSDMLNDYCRRWHPPSASLISWDKLCKDIGNQEAIWRYYNILLNSTCLFLASAFIPLCLARRTTMIQSIMEKHRSPHWAVWLLSGVPESTASAMKRSISWFIRIEVSSKSARASQV